MSEPIEVTEIEASAKAAGLKMTRVLARAGVPYTAWWRWKHRDVDPQTKSLRKVRQAIADMTA